MHEAFGRSADKRKDLRLRLKHKLDEKELTDRQWHSASYHRYFEGYAEEVVRTANGRKRIVRTYEGPVYIRMPGDHRQNLVKGAYLAGFAAMTALVIWTGMQERAGDASWYMALAELATLLALSGMAYALFVNYLPSPQRMTAGQHRGASGLVRKLSAALAAGFGLCLLFTAAFLLLHGDVATPGDRAALFTFLAGAAIAAAICLTERSLPYAVTEGSGAEAEGKEIITY